MALGNQVKVRADLVLGLLSACCVSEQGKALMADAKSKFEEPGQQRGANCTLSFDTFVTLVTSAEALLVDNGELRNQVDKMREELRSKQEAPLDAPSRDASPVQGQG